MAALLRAGHGGVPRLVGTPFGRSPLVVAEGAEAVGGVGRRALVAGWAGGATRAKAAGTAAGRMAGNARGWASEATKAAAAAAYREPVWAAEEAEGMAEAMPAGPPSATERVVGSLVTAVGTVASAAGLALGVAYQYYSVDQLESMADARFGPRVDALPDLDENGAPPPPSSADQQLQLQQQQQQQQRREVGFAETAARKFIDTRRWMDHQINYYIEPSAEKLLPDLPEAYRAHARTLVLDLDDTLVHSDWTRARGWRVFKRPGVDEFLDRMSQFYELVVYTHQNHTYVEPIMDRLDPQRRSSSRSSGRMRAPLPR